MTADTTSQTALAELASRTAAAVGEVLGRVAGDIVEMRTATVTDKPEAAFGALTVPVVLSEVAYVDGVAGGNVLGITVAGAQYLAAAMGAEPGDDPEEISETGLSAVGDLASQMLAAAGATMAAALGQPVDIGAPATRLVDDLGAALAPYEAARDITSISFTVAGEHCRLVQFLPQPFVTRLTAALAQAGQEAAAAQTEPPPASLEALEAVNPSSLAGTRLHVGVELGRTRMTIGQITGLPDGAIVALDRKASDPIDVCVNGVMFAYGRLVRSDGGVAVVIDGFAGIPPHGPGEEPAEPIGIPETTAPAQSAD